MAKVGRQLNVLRGQDTVLKRKSNRVGKVRFQNKREDSGGLASGNDKEG